MSKKYSPPPSKEALVIILDVGKSMGTRSFKAIEDAKKAVSLLVKMKIRYKPKDEIGLVLVGTKKTNNHLNDEYEDEYQHISISHTIQPVDLDLFKKIEAIECENATGDLIDAVVLATDMINEHTGKRKYLRRIFIVTDAGSPIRSKDEITKILKPIKSKNIVINVIGIDFTSSDVKKENPTPKEENEQFLYNICEMVDGIVIPIQQAIETLNIFRSKRILQRTTFRGLLEISSHLKIPIWLYKKTDKTALPTSKKFSIISEQSEAGGEGNVRMDRTYFLLDDPDVQVPEDKRVKAYKYGKNTVPFNKVDEKGLKLETKKGMQVLGFTEKEKIPRHHFMGTCYQIIPQPCDKEASVAFSALVRALAEMGRVAIVRYVNRENSDPQIGFLAPHIEPDHDSFYFLTLPFIEDLRTYPFRSFDGIELSDEQLQAAEDLINAMDMMDAELDDEGRPKEALNPSETFHPIVQHFYECCHHRVLHPNDPLPKMDDVILKYCFPELSNDSCYQRIMKKAEESIKQFKKLFPLKKSEKEEEKRGKKRYWFATKEQDISLESYQINKEQSAKRMKTEEEVSEISTEQLVAIKNKIGFDNIFQDKADNVGTIDPVKDFNDMFTRRDVDLVDKAIEQMQQVIQKFVNDSIGNQYYEKALNCLIALRKGCITEEESEAFNSFLKKCKNLYANGKRKDFWELVKKNKITLISDQEADDSTVTQETADKFHFEEDEMEDIEEEKKEDDEGDELFEDLE